MDTSTFDFDTLTLVVTIVGSMLTLVILMHRQFNHFDKKFDRKFDELNTKVGRLETTIAPIDARFDGIDARLDGIDTRFDKLEARFDAMGHDMSDARERLARIEGHLMGPESFRMRSPRPTAPDEPSSEDPEPDQRRAG